MTRVYFAFKIVSGKDAIEETMGRRVFEKIIAIASSAHSPSVKIFGFEDYQLSHAR
jgi:hypothetical protein